MAKLQSIPKGMSIVQVGSDFMLRPKTRSRRKYKTPAAVRKRIAASARKMKIPLLTVSANTVVIADAYAEADRGTKAPFLSARFQKFFWNNVTRRYSGFDILTRKFVPMQASGLISNAILMGVRKLGVFKGTNKLLAKSRLPVRLA